MRVYIEHILKNKVGVQYYNTEHMEPSQVNLKTFLFFKKKSKIHFNYPSFVPSPLQCYHCTYSKIKWLPAEAQIAYKTGLWTLKRTKTDTQEAFPLRGKKSQLKKLADTQYITQHTDILSGSLPASQLNGENFLLEINYISFHIVLWSLSL